MIDELNQELADFIGQFYADPLGYVLAAYPWDSNPSIQLCTLPEPWRARYPNCHYGPDAWSCRVMDEIGRQVRENAFDGRHAVKPIRIAVSSGHGIGKSCLSSWLIDWIMSTRPYAKGTVTATTNGQLATRTWAQIKAWTTKALTYDWFDVKDGRGSMELRSREAPSEWFVSAQSCRKENSEAFAGQHAANSTSFYLFDEGSGIDDKIYEVAEGGLTDGEPMFFVFGNPTRNSGAFYDIFHKYRDQWTCFKIDSREAQITNKPAIQAWIDLYGFDSDFVRVRVRGEFPNASDCQFIPQNIVEAAMARPSMEFHPGEHPVCVVGVDLAGPGSDDTAIATRIGPEVLKIEAFHETSVTAMCTRIKEHVNWLYDTYGFEKVYVFMDSGGIGYPYVTLLKESNFPVNGVNFGQGADKPMVYLNKRSEMWARMKEWLQGPMAKLPDDDDLKYDLVAPEYFHQITDNRLALESKEEMKKRGLHSPDKADALALTFAEIVYERAQSVGPDQGRASYFTRESRRNSLSNRRRFNR